MSARPKTHLQLQAPGGPGDGGAPRNPAQAAALEARRKRGVQAIQAARRALGLDEDTYRAMLARLAGGKTSSTQLTLREQAKVLDHLRRAGAVNPRQARRDAQRAGGPDGRRARGTPTDAKAALVAKLNALLTELERVTGEPHSLDYADAICRRNGWAERIDFCSPEHLRAVVGAVARTLRAKAARSQPAGRTGSTPPAST